MICAGGRRFALVLLSLALTACETVQTTQSGAVGVDRKQYMAVSSKELDQAASKQYAELIAQAKEKNLLNRNPAQLARVQTIANRLIAQTPVFRPDARNWKWEVNVLTSDEVNA